MPDKSPKARAAKSPASGGYAMQPITKPDTRYPKTRVARPDDDSVEESRDWVMEHEQ